MKAKQNRKHFSVSFAKYSSFFRWKAGRVGSSKWLYSQASCTEWLLFEGVTFQIITLSDTVFELHSFFSLLRLLSKQVYSRSRWYLLLWSCHLASTHVVRPSLPGLYTFRSGWIYSLLPCPLESLLVEVRVLPWSSILHRRMVLCYIHQWRGLCVHLRVYF